MSSYISPITSTFFPIDTTDHEKKITIPTLVNLCVQVIRRELSTTSSKLTLSHFPAAVHSCEAARKLLFEDKELHIFNAFGSNTDVVRDMISSIIELEPERLTSFVAGWKHPFLNILILKFTHLKKQDDLLKILKLLQKKSEAMQVHRVGVQALEKEVDRIDREPTKSLFTQLLEQRCPEGRGVLHMAARYTDSKEIIEMLLKHAGRDELLREDSKGRTPIQLAYEHNTEKAIEHLTSSLSSLELDTLKASYAKTGWTPLHSAAKNGSREFLSELIKTHPESIHAQDISKQTPLKIALIHKKFDNVKELLEHSSPDALFAERALFSTIHYPVDILEILWRKCPDLFTTKWEGARTDLLSCIFGGYTLLGHALHASDHRRATKIVQLLPEDVLKQVIALDSLEVLNVPLIDYHNKEYFLKYCTTLLSKYPEAVFLKEDDTESTFLSAILRNGSSVIQQIVNHLPDSTLHMIDSKSGDSVLHYLASSWHTDSFKTVLNRVSLELLYTKNKKGETALACAIISGKLEIAKIIIEVLPKKHLAETSANPVNSQTIFHWIMLAIRSDNCKIEEAKEFITYLLTKFPKEWLSKKDENGKTAYAFAKIMSIQDHLPFLDPTKDM